MTLGKTDYEFKHYAAEVLQWDPEAEVSFPPARNTINKDIVKYALNGFRKGVMRSALTELLKIHAEYCRGRNNQKLNRINNILLYTYVIGGQRPGNKIIAEYTHVSLSTVHIERQQGIRNLQIMLNGYNALGIAGHVVSPESARELFEAIGLLISGEKVKPSLWGKYEGYTAMCRDQTAEIVALVIDAMNEYKRFCAQSNDRYFDERSYKIFKKHFIDGVPVKEIAATTGMCKKSIYKILDQAETRIAVILSYKFQKFQEKKSISA